MRYKFPLKESLNTKMLKGVNFDSTISHKQLYTLCKYFKQFFKVYIEVTQQLQQDTVNVWSFFSFFFSNHGFVINSETQGGVPSLTVIKYWNVLKWTKINNAKLMWFCSDEIYFNHETPDKWWCPFTSALKNNFQESLWM